MSCCNNYIGSFPHSGNIRTGITGTQSGKYVLELEFAGSKEFKEINIIGPAELIIYGPFNEDYLYKLKIRQPDQTYLEVSGCSDHSFKTFVLVTNDCGGDCDFEYN